MKVLRYILLTNQVRNHNYVLLEIDDHIKICMWQIDNTTNIIILKIRRDYAIFV